MKRWQARAGWAAVALFYGALILIALREITNSSTFQLFGDFVARVETTEKVVALTFDDGPHPVNTPRMLDLLDRHGVKATFFMMGRNVERYPEIARQVVLRGHEVGNHSYSHPKMIWMTPVAIRDEIERTDRLLRGVGAAGPLHFRAPHASKFVVLPYVLSQVGKLNVQGDVDPEEWKQRPASVMTASVLEQVRPGSIIGFHDTQGAATLETVDHVVGALRIGGYRFETVSAFIRLLKK